MIYQSPGQSVTSINSLISTIKIDSQVRRWFTHLILEETVRSKLSKNEEIKAAYKRFGNIAYQEKFAWCLLLSILFFAVATQQFKYGFLVLIFFLTAFILQRKKKECVLKICSVQINNDFNKFSFAQNTLYQIGEFYSRKYNIVSLVRTTTFVNIVTRKAFLYTIIFVTFIRPLNFWQIYASILTVYFIFYQIVSTDFIYKRIK